MVVTLEDLGADMTMMVLAVSSPAATLSFAAVSRGCHAIGCHNSVWDSFTDDMAAQNPDDPPPPYEGTACARFYWYRGLLEGRVAELMARRLQAFKELPQAFSALRALGTVTAGGGADATFVDVHATCQAQPGRRNVVEERLPIAP